MGQGKKLERDHVLQFLKLLADPPRGPLVDCETPDFLIGEVGIEHTTIFSDEGLKGSRARRQQDLQERVLAIAEAECLRASGVPLGVRVSFSEQVPLVPERISAAADQLCEAVLLVAPAPGSRIVLHEGRLPAEVSFASARGYPPHIKSSWLPLRGGYDQELTRAILEPRIQGKEKRLAVCRQQARLVWLVLVADGSAPSSYFDLEDGELPGIEFEFDRVFVFRWPGGPVVELAPE